MKYAYTELYNVLNSPMDEYLILNKHYADKTKKNSSC